MEFTGFDSLDFTTFYNIVNGERKTTSSTRYSLNPAYGTPNPAVPLSTPTDVEEAVVAARSAFPRWAAEPWQNRRSALFKFADAMEQKKDEFAKLLNREQGKPVGITLSSPAFSSCSPLSFLCSVLHLTDCIS